MEPLDSDICSHHGENQPCRVLIVDDSKTMLKTYEVFVRNDPVLRSLEVDYASNAAEGLEKLKKVSYSLIILDWEMPEVNGLEMLAKLRSDASYDSIKIVMATSVGDKSKMIKAIRIGIDDYVVKPINAETFLKTIQKHLNV